MDTERYQQTERTRVRRLPERAAYDRDTVHAILDEGFICHVGFVVDGRPFVIPTGYARAGETLYLHGSTGSRLGLRPGMDVCVTVTLLDGLVLARSAFHHSMNYRSVVVLGRTRALTDPDEKEAALRALVEHIVPGRSDAVRGADRRELAATAVLALPLAEVSAKVRTGPPVDDEPDYDLPIWAGVLPLRQVADPPVPDDRLDPSLAVPTHVAAWHRPTRGRGHDPVLTPRARQASSVTPATTRRRSKRGRWVAAARTPWRPWRRSSVARGGSATSSSPSAWPASISSASRVRMRAKVSSSAKPASWNSTWCSSWLARAKS